MIHSAVVKVSDKQMSKLRNGHKVRVKKPEVEGEGCYVIVSPENYDIITRTFSRNKGVELALSPEEIQANKVSASSPERHKELMGQHKVGQGIFGKKFDRAVRKVIGKKAQKAIYGVANQFLPLAQFGLTAGLNTAGTALSALNPELAPFIQAGTSNLAQMGSDYLANPNAKGGIKVNKTLAQEYAKNLALKQLNEKLGTNMGDLSSASIEKAVADRVASELSRLQAQQRETQPMAPINRGAGLYVGSSGNGLYAGKIRRSGGAVGLNGGFVGQLPPALQSQPFSANFQFQHTLPPAYQKFSKGAGVSF